MHSNLTSYSSIKLTKKKHKIKSKVKANEFETTIGS